MKQLVLGWQNSNLARAQVGEGLRESILELERELGVLKGQTDALRAEELQQDRGQIETD